MYTNYERIHKNLVEKYKSVYVVEVGDEIYMYRLLSKMMYELICAQIEDDMELQDEIIRKCVLYPEDLDIDEMFSEDVAELAQIIVSQSCVLPEDRIKALEVFSAEMNQIDNVMACLIMKAFPAYKLSDLEEMEFPEFYRLYTRAEWFITTIQQEPLLFSAIDTLKESIGIPTGSAQSNSDFYNNGHDEQDEQQVMPQQEEQPKQESKYMGRNLSEVMNEINNSNSKRKPMTAEQKAELDKFRAQFPDIDMSQDPMYTGELLSQRAGVISREATRRKY